MKLNRPFVGLIMGLLLPLLGMFIVYLVWGHNETVTDFAKKLTRQSGMASKVMTLGLLTNLIPFVYSNMKRLDHLMRGIVVATMLYAVFIVLVMFVW